VNHVPRKQIEARQRRGGCISIALAIVAIFVVFRITAGWTIDYQWWKEMGQPAVMRKTTKMATMARAMLIQPPPRWRA